MAEETLVKENLTSKMIRGGEDLVKALDKSGWQPTSAFWLFNPEQNRWRLILGLPQVDSHGPRQAYDFIIKLLHSMETPDIDLHDVSARSPNERLVKLVSSAIKTEPGTNGFRYTRNTIDGKYIEDAYIYRTESHR
jgi:hypothetical protein